MGRKGCRRRRRRARLLRAFIARLEGRFPEIRRKLLRGLGIELLPATRKLSDLSDDERAELKRQIRKCMGTSCGKEWVYEPIQLVDTSALEGKQVTWTCVAEEKEDDQEPI